MVGNGKGWENSNGRNVELGVAVSVLVTSFSCLFVSSMDLHCTCNFQKFGFVVAHLRIGAASGGLCCAVLEERLREQDVPCPVAGSRT